MAEGLRINATQTTADIALDMGNQPSLPQGDLPEDLATYLKELGLDGAHLAKVLSLVEATQAEEQVPLVPPVSPEVQAEQAGYGSNLPCTNLVKLCLAEEQPILKIVLRCMCLRFQPVD